MARKRVSTPSTSKPRRAKSQRAIPREKVDPREKIQHRAGKVHVDLAAQRRLQRALEAMEAFRDQAREQHERLTHVETVLQASRDLYAELYDYAPIGYFTLDVNGVIENINVTGTAMLKRERRLLIGTPFQALVAQQDWRTFQEHRMAAQRGRPVTVELSVQQQHGDSFPVQLSTRESLLASRSGRRCYLMVMTDLTDLRQNEVERQRLSSEHERTRLSDEARDRFLAMLSHELRTPLTPITAALSDPDLMRGVPDTTRATLEMIRRNIAMETQLVEDLLDVSRIKQGKLRMRIEPMDVHAAIDESITMIDPEARAQDVKLIKDLCAQRHWIEGDPMRLRQVMWNLLRNAVKFTPRHGSVRIRSIDAGPNITVSVRDTGIGIDPDALERLFTPFEQVSPITGAGLGLGLTICRGLIEAHHGEIVAHSEGVGAGSTFEFTLATTPAPTASVAAAKTALPTAVPQMPSSPTPASPTLPPAPESIPASENALRIMLIEDHSDTAFIMSRLLKARGYQVSVAGCCGEALMLADRGGEPSFDLVISDITLPDGSGLDLMRRLKEKGGITRGIALSGLVSEDDVRRSREAGFEEHLAKPIDFNKLVGVIDQITSDIPTSVAT